ncbi:MAG: class I SAM-dependent methyltransferase [Phycisphaerae bacterium]
MDAPRVERVPAQAGYDRWAEIYDHEDNALIQLEERELPALLGGVAELDVVDVGCGTGRWALRLAEQGARVTGLDFSEGMLERARRKPGAERVRFLAHDARAPLPLADASFDRVLCCLVLEHVASPAGLFRELARVCRRGGFILCSAMHPAMMLRGISARFTDPATGVETRPQSHPHQISDFVNAALAAGVAIDHLSEHPVDETLAARSPRAVKYVGWPMLFLLRARRLAGG